MEEFRKPCLLLTFVITANMNSVTQAQKNVSTSPVLQRCIEYSGAGDLLRAQVTAQSFSISITRPSGQMVELTGSTTAPVSRPQFGSATVPCQLALSASSDRAALSVTTDTGLDVNLIDVKAGTLMKTLSVARELSIQFPLHPIGYFSGSDRLAISQAHYRPTGEPEIVTRFISSDGSNTSTAYTAAGAPYTEVSASSFDFRDGRVWFLCPAYSERIDRQPRCTLKSATLNEAPSLAEEIPPPPDDRVIGSGQPNLGFPSAHECVLLANKRLWLYDFSVHSFRQMDLPETPQHIRWFEFPGQPKFSADGLFAAVPVYLFHYPMFQEGQVSHGTKLLIVDLARLQILKTIQPPRKLNVVDFALRHDPKGLSLVASWGEDWQSFDIATSLGSS